MKADLGQALCMTLTEYLTGLPRNDFHQFHFLHYAQLSSNISFYLKPFIITPYLILLDAPLGDSTNKGEDHVYLNHHSVTLYIILNKK